MRGETESPHILLPVSVGTAPGLKGMTGGMRQEAPPSRELGKTSCGHMLLFSILSYLILS